MEKLEKVIEEAFNTYLMKQTIKGYKEAIVRFNPNDIFQAIAQAVADAGYKKYPFGGYDGPLGINEYNNRDK